MKNLMILVNSFFLTVGCVTQKPSRIALDLGSHSIGSLMAKADVVMLGESIHLTRELSLAREPYIRWLAHNRQFNLLAFEGSMVEAWIGMDQALAEKTPDSAAAQFQKSALFGLWQTEEVKQVLTSATEIALKGSFYISSYDVQMGQGFRFLRGDSIFASLLDRLSLRGVKINEEDRAAILRLDRLSLCKARRFPSTTLDSLTIEEGIIKIDKLIKKMPSYSDTLTGKFHDFTLRFLPESLRHELAFCQEAQRVTGSYTSLRDQYAARLFGRFLSLMNTLQPKVVVWAHAGHTRMAPSGGEGRFGYFLQKETGSSPFSIAFSAVEGEALVFQREDGIEVEPFKKSLFSLEKVSLESKLSKLGLSDGLFDLCDGTESKILLDIETMRLEPDGITKIRPCLDFQALHLVRKVTPPKWEIP